MSAMEAESIVTVASAKTGMSESLPVNLTSTTVKELSEWCNALFGLEGDVRLFKDGRVLDPGMKLEQAGVCHGDLLAAQEATQSAPASGNSSNAAAAGGLDFSSLLAGASAASSSGGGGGGGGMDFSNLLGQSNAPQNNAPVYYPGMSFNDAWEHNPSPEHIVTLLQSKEHMFKELNYHQPSLANKIRGQPYERAVQIWREEIIKGGIQTAMSRTTTFHKEADMKRRLKDNPNDAEAKEYFAKIERKEKVQEQYMQMMQEYPESLGRVLMLYIEAKVNGHAVQAFVDSGAQSTIMSKKVATECGILDFLDTRFEGIAVGVGTGKILGRIHIVQLELGGYHFPCTITIMDDPKPDANGNSPSEMPFLLGLDMLKRHTCSIDLENQVLKFRLAPGQYMETPFLHEKDLEAGQGGTKGFDAAKANQELEDAQRKHEEDDAKKGGSSMED